MIALITETLQTIDAAPEELKGYFIIFWILFYLAWVGVNRGGEEEHEQES